MNPRPEHLFPPAELWSVWRTDDTGNTFLVREHLSKADADGVVAEFTARGHKQYYFAELENPEAEPSLTPPS